MCGSAACEAVPAVEHLLHGWCNHRNCGDAGCLAWPGIHAVARHAQALHLVAKAGRYPDPHDGTGCSWWRPVRHSWGKQVVPALCLVSGAYEEDSTWHVGTCTKDKFIFRGTAPWCCMVDVCTRRTRCCCGGFPATQLLGRRKDWRAVLWRWHLLLDQVGPGVVRGWCGCKASWAVCGTHTALSWVQLLPKLLMLLLLSWGCV